MIALAATFFTGCASLQDYQYENSQMFRGWLEYHNHGNPDRKNFPHDYRRGWLEGFGDRVMGGPDTPPIIAPARYWKPTQITQDGDARRQAYYSGWQDGAARAALLPDTHYLRVFETPASTLPRCNCGIADCNCVIVDSSLVDDSVNPTFP